MNQKIELGPSIVGRNYFLTETYGPFCRVTTTQSGHYDFGLINWFKKTKLEEIEKRGKETAHKGTVLHGMFAGHLSGEKVVVEDEWSQKPFDYFKEFLADKKIRPVANELTMVSRSLGIGGTADAVVDMMVEDEAGDVGPERWLIDWKTGTESDSYFGQLAMYAIMYWELTGEWINKHALVYVHRDGKKAKMVVSESPIMALMSALFTYERWKMDNREALKWVCGPEELWEKRKNVRKVKRPKYDEENHKPEYVWPWLEASSLRWLEGFKEERKAK